MFRSLPNFFWCVWLFEAALPPGWAADTFCSASYITDQVRGESTINEQGSNYQAINVFSYQFNGSCHLEPKSTWEDDISRELVNDPNRLILIDIVNELSATPGPCADLGDSAMLQRVLSDPVQRAQHIKEIVAISALGQGIEIDYEHVLRATTPLLTQFMQELRAALPAEKRLAAVVQPKTPGGGEQGHTVDWKGIEPYVDYLRVMAYYYSYNTSPPGPVITYAMLGKLADTILTNPTYKIPANKARILLSLYGWDWPVSPRGSGKLIRFEDAMQIARDRNITPVRDPVEDTLHFQYTAPDNSVHEIWVDDAMGTQKRVQLLMSKDVPAIDLWHLNTGDAALWNWFTPHVRGDCPRLAVPASPPSGSQLTVLQPSAVKTASGDTIVSISGSGFSSSDMVLFAGAPFAPISVEPTLIKVLIPATHLQKQGRRRVNVVQNARLSSTLDFYVVGNPTLTSVVPPAVSAGAPAFMLAVLGNGFEPASLVRFNGRDLTPQFVSAQELRASIPAELVARPATFAMGVINPTSGTRIGQNYAIVAGPTPPSLPGAPSIPEVPASPSPPLTISEFKVGPNPWTAGKDTGGINFYGVSEKEVKIFTVAGKFVRRVQPAAGVANWDLTNDHGEQVAAGLYFYLTDAVGSHQRGTLAVIR